MKKEKREGMIVKLGIAQKLMLGILIPLILVLSGIGVLLGIQISGTVEQMVTKNLTSQAEAGTHQVNAFLKQYYGVVDTMVCSPEIAGLAADQAKPRWTAPCISPVCLQNCRESSRSIRITCLASGSRM